MKRKACLLLLIIGILLITVPDTWANGDRAADLVAPYAYFAWSVPPATGPFTTHYLINNPQSYTISVDVKCYSDINNQRVGPAAGTTYSIGANAIRNADPVTLGLTTDPNFTGFGWCYFAGTDYFSVGFVTGISVGGNLITTDNSRAVMSGTAQHHVTTWLGSIPYWTSEGSWETYILAMNPTATNRTLTVRAYNNVGGLVGTWTPSLQRRDIDYGTIASLVGAPAYTGWGSAEIEINGRGFVGWIAGINFTSYQAFISPVPLSISWISPLASGDRP
jgi:hypothetical protein